MKNNLAKNKLHWTYLSGIFLILTLPILTLPPYFFPPDFGKNIAFRSIMSVLLFLIAIQLVYKKNKNITTTLRNNKAMWLLGALFAVFLMASIFSVDSYFSLWGSPVRGGGFINFAFYIIFAVFLFLVLKDHDWQKIIDFSIFTGIIVASLSVVQFFGILSNIFVSVSGGPSSTSGNRILLATYMLLLCFISLSFLFKKNNIWKKIFYSGAFLLFVFTILISESRASYLGLVIGAIYFFFFIPKKMPKLKIGFGLLLLLSFSVFILVNTNTSFSNFLSQNRLLNNVIHRISFEKMVDKNRLASWNVGLKAIAQRPILGYGPENFSVGFDKFYDPTIPYLGFDWWDRQHNILLETAITAGIPALTIYLLLFIFIFWQLQKTKGRAPEKSIVCHGLQATFIAYFVAIFFSFDDFSTYLTFFLFIAYSMHLVYSNENDQNYVEEENRKQIKGNFLAPVILLAVLVLFLWQYNFIPLQINAKINIAGYLANQQQCEASMTLMDMQLKRHSFLDSYLRAKYIEYIKICAQWNSDKNLNYAKKGIFLLKEAVKVQPSYTRYWIYLGSFTNILINQENNTETKKQLVEEAYSYFETAKNLSPKRPEIYKELAKTALLEKNYNKALEAYNKLVEFFPGDYIYHANLTDVYIALNNIQKVKEEALKILELNPPQEMKDKTEKLIKFLEDNYK